MKHLQFFQKVPFLLVFCFGTLMHAQIMYQPNNVVRNTIRKEQWKHLKLKTPKKQRFMTGLVFGSNQCFDLYEKAAREKGWDPYELPTVASFYKIVLQETVNGREFTEAEIRNTYNILKTDYESKGFDMDTSNRDLQLKYDPMVIKAIWIGTINELAKGKSPEIKELAKTMLNTFKSNLESKSAIISSSAKIDGPPETSATGKPRMDSKQMSNHKVTDVILRTSTKYGLGGTYISNDVSVLYENGDIFTNPVKPLDQLDVIMSKREKPKKWRKWTKKGKVLYIKDPRKGKTYDWKKWFQLRPGDSGFRLSGTFNTSDGFGGTSVINASTVVFDGKGRFAWKTVKGGNTVWKPVFSKSASAGTYSIDTYSITLNYNNGTQETFFFGLYPKDNQHFVIGGSHFAKVKD